MAKLRVRVQPGARRNEVLGFQEGVLRVRITAPPIEGRANKALVEFLAERLDVPKRDVAVVAGTGSRDKLIEVAGLDGEAVRIRLASA